MLSRNNQFNKSSYVFSGKENKKKYFLSNKMNEIISTNNTNESGPLSEDDLKEPLTLKYINTKILKSEYPVILVINKMIVSYNPSAEKFWKKLHVDLSDFLGEDYSSLPEESSCQCFYEINFDENRLIKLSYGN